MHFGVQHCNLKFISFCPLQYCSETQGY